MVSRGPQQLPLGCGGHLVRPSGHWKARAAHPGGTAFLGAVLAASGFVICGGRNSQENVLSRLEGALQSLVEPRAVSSRGRLTRGCVAGSPHPEL